MHPFTQSPEQSIAHIGENSLLDSIRRWLGTAMPDYPEGMGDDCSIASLENQNLLTSDSLVFGRHFDSTLSPEEAGAKLIKRNVSDIAAMGGRPGRALFSGGFPRTTSIQWLQRFVNGLASSALEYGVVIVGGDLAETQSDWIANIALTGYAKKPLQRRGGQIGDQIWVTGALGGSILGRHAQFEPRINEGLFLAETSPYIHQVIDLTDGISKDLRQLIPDNSSACIQLGEVPLHDDAILLSQKSGSPPIDHALTDGEDYELLFLVPGNVDANSWQKFWYDHLKTPVHCIGHLIPKVDSAEIIDKQTGKPLSFSHGFQHFS